MLAKTPHGSTNIKQSITYFKEFDFWLASVAAVLTTTYESKSQKNARLNYRFQSIPQRSKNVNFVRQRV